MQMQSALLVPEPICNHGDLVPNDLDPFNDHMDSRAVQLIESPEDFLLDHLPKQGAGGETIISSFFIVSPP